jgi:hypothetical protein
LQFSSKRGHFLTVDAKTDGSFKLPEIFIQVSKQGKKLQCSTEALIRLNQRNNDSLNEILLMTERYKRLFLALSDLEEHWIV